MAGTKTKSIAVRVIGVFVFAIVWVCLSLVITVLFAEAEDPDVPSAPVPWLLRALYMIARFPVCYAMPWNALQLDLGETEATDVELLGIFANGVFWGIVFCVVWLKFLQFIRKKRGRTL